MHIIDKELNEPIPAISTCSTKCSEVYTSVGLIKAAYCPVCEKMNIFNADVEQDPKARFCNHFLKVKDYEKDTFFYFQHVNSKDLNECARCKVLLDKDYLERLADNGLDPETELILCPQCAKE